MITTKREDRILDAIFGKGCRSIQSIADSTGIDYKRVFYFLKTRLGGAESLRALRQQEEFGIAVDKFEKGMTLKGLMQVTGISEYRLKPHFKAIRMEEIRRRRVAGERKREGGELRETHDSIMDCMDKHIHTRSMAEDPIYNQAVNFRLSKRSHVPFEKLYTRLQDIYAGRSIFDCAERWSITITGVEGFIKSIDMYDLYKEKHFARLVPDLEKKETAILEAICDENCSTITEISDATGISESETNMIVRHAGLQKDIIQFKKQREYEAVVAVYKDRVEERVKPGEIAKASRVVGMTASKAGTYMRKFRDEQRKQRARERYPQLLG